jgi:3-methylfumaryl-CoA hydratase
MAAMLDQDPDVWRHGSEMPESWYVILFGPIALQRTLVRDGHLPTGDFLPPMGRCPTHVRRPSRALLPARRA